MLKSIDTKHTQNSTDEEQKDENRSVSYSAKIARYLQSLVSK